MKRFFLFAVIMFSMTTFAMKAQNAPKDYFAGKWEIVVEGTPDGDMQMKLELVRKDGKLTGNMVDPKGKKVEISRVDEREKSIDFYFTSDNGYDVTADLIMKSADEVSGSIMSMFSLKGKRIK